MAAIGISVILFLVLAPDIYISALMIRGAGWVLQLLHWIPAAAMASVAVLAFSGARWVSHQAALTSLFAILLLFALPKFFFMIFSLLGRLAGLAWTPLATGGNWLGLLVAAAVFCAAFYGFVFGWHRVVVNEREVVLEGLPEAFDGYRIAHLSDLHLGTYHLAPKTVGRIVERVNGLNPDLIVFTGDIVNAHPSEAGMFSGDLSRLSAPDGVLSILGNHDYCEYYHFDSASDRAAAVEAVKDFERSTGWDLLLDESRVIRRGTDSIAVVGVQNISKPPFPSYGSLSKALEGLPDGIFKILLSHDPSHWRLGVLPDSDVRLTLSGHTHGAQIRFGRFSPSKFLYPEWGGLYHSSSLSSPSSILSTTPSFSSHAPASAAAPDRILHVSVGTGGNVPFRLGCPAEIDLLILRRG